MVQILAAIRRTVGDPTSVPSSPTLPRTMAGQDPIRGDLQEQIMRVLWRLGRGSVEEVRKALPKRGARAYTTVQTVLNRLAERGLLKRERVGKAIFYSPRASEAEYLSRSLSRTLSGASPEARRAALATLVGGLDDSEMSEINSLASEFNRKRRRRPR
jgi:predicted transcriptional regulator